MVAVYRNLSSYQSLRGVRWAILLEQPEADAYALARTGPRATPCSPARISLFLALALGIFLAARLTRPLGRLAERADAIAGGDEPPAPPVRGPGEIGELGERIEDMARRLAERAELQAALARGDRLATVGTLSACVAHEVNNPLTTVLGYAQLMLEDKPEDHPDRPGLELIAGEAARMKTIVAGLLDYARVEHPEDDAGRGPADVAAVMGRVATLMGPQLKRSRVRLAVDVPADLAEAACGPHALQQVLVNLIQNARQAMDDGGTITRGGGARRRRPGRGHGHRRGPRRPRRSPGPDLRAVLHDQGAGRRHRARPGGVPAAGPGLGRRARRSRTVPAVVARPSAS